MMLIDMIIGIGLVAMFWCVSDKYELWQELYIKATYKYRMLPKSICVMCITFWLLLTYFLVIGEGLGATIIKSLASTPFVLELTKRIWHN